MSNDTNFAETFRAKQKEIYPEETLFYRYQDMSVWNTFIHFSQGYLFDVHNFKHINVATIKYLHQTCKDLLDIGIQPTQFPYVTKWVKWYAETKKKLYNQ